MFLGNEEMVYILQKTQGNAVQIDGHPAWGLVWCVISPCQSSRPFNGHLTGTQHAPGDDDERAHQQLFYVWHASPEWLVCHFWRQRGHQLRTLPLFSVWKLKPSSHLLPRPMMMSTATTMAERLSVYSTRIPSQLVLHGLSGSTTLPCSPFKTCAGTPLQKHSQMAPSSSSAVSNTSGGYVNRNFLNVDPEFEGGP